MIRMIPSSSAGHAKAYFNDALSKSDYYLDDQELAGRMQGKLAERLGLSGPVTKEVFHNLCDNIDPNTGKPLTPRTKENRITGYDISFSCPKSVSILHGLSNDDHILTAFQESVRLTMQDIEHDSKTRVRQNGLSEDRNTGELIWAEFVHQTSRPLEGQLPDPQLHSHNFLINCTWDESEQRIKAARFTDIKRDMPYYQELFFKRLSDKLIDGGYQIRRTEKSFEVEGVPQHVIDLFSKRKTEIEQTAKDKGIVDPQEMSELGARTRTRKQKGHSMTELKDNWRQQIVDLGPQSEGEGQRTVRHAPIQGRTDLTPQHCVDHAILHGFERASVQGERRLLASAYRQSIGQRSVSLEAVTAELKADERLVHVAEQGRTFCTTRQVLSEEQRMVDLARQGQGKLRPLYEKTPAMALDGQQAEAVGHVLTTPHRVSIIRGAAGSGKTTLMKEAVSLIEKTGRKVTVVAPTAQASRGVLRDEGFAGAETVARLLVDEKMQQSLQDQVIWCDEAGLLGTGDMTALLEIATRQNARLILGGDTRQHASVVRGDALRILNTVGGIKTAEVSRIYRQRGADYRSAVDDLAKGDTGSGFVKLDRMGAIETIDPLQPNDALVKDYVDALRKGKSALIVSPTHKQADSVTDDVRAKLQDRGFLSKKEVSADRLTNLNLTEAERSDWRNFQPGQVIQFNQNLPGIRRGRFWIVERSNEQDGVQIQNDQGQSLPLPKDRSRDFDVYYKSEIALAKGDAVRITRNGFDKDGTRLNNGQTLDVVKVSKQGDVVLRNAQSKVAYRLDKEFGHIAHNYCVTSHASQGRTVDEVFISQPAETFGATNAKQFYVSVSRARDRVRIYTDDKDQLLLNAAEIGDRQSALELVSRKNRNVDLVQQRIRDDLNRSPVIKERPKDVPKPSRIKDRDYEPGL